MALVVTITSISSVSVKPVTSSEELEWGIEPPKKESQNAQTKAHEQRQITAEFPPWQQSEGKELLPRTTYARGMEALGVGCNSPLRAYKAPGGKITFHQRSGYYDMPLQIACGQCRGCRLRRTRDWAVRAIHESQMHEQNSFVTLTYDDENLPADNGLVVKHWQDFAKRLRKKMGPFRFLHCGEYGEKTLRPHYHACLFGHDFRTDRQPIGNPSGHPLYMSPDLEELWGKGFVSIGELTFDSAAYVASYVFKKTNGETAERRNERVDERTGEVWAVKGEYATMSRRPGLGAAWFAKYSSDIYPHDFAVAKGQQFRPPKFYDQLLKERDPGAWEKIHTRRAQHVRERPEEATTERKEVKEEILRRKQKENANRHL